MGEVDLPLVEEGEGGEDHLEEQEGGPEQQGVEEVQQERVGEVVGIVPVEGGKVSV